MKESNEPQGGNQRRHLRRRVTWLVTVQAEERLLRGETVNVGPQGAKVRLGEPLEVGTRVTLHIAGPEDGPTAIEAIVWRVDNDGVVFFFLPMGAGTGPGAQSPSLTPRETILVVDDEPEVLGVAADVLERSGYTVLTSVDPFEALRMVHTGAEPIHLLLTDIVMPRMHGVQLAEELRAIRPGVKVLFMSAYTSEQVEDHGAQLLPGVSLLVKPFSQRALLEKVRSVLDYRSPFAREPRRPLPHPGGPD